MTKFRFWLLEIGIYLAIGLPARSRCGEGRCLICGISYYLTIVVSYIMLSYLLLSQQGNNDLSCPLGRSRRPEFLTHLIHGLRHSPAQDGIP